MRIKKYIIPIFVPHLGCPFQCIFCNQKTISGVKNQVTGIEVQQIVYKYLTTIPPDASVEVAFYGGSFTGIDIKKQKELLEAVFKFIKEKKIQSIRISTRPDYINKDILDFLKMFKVDTIELGVQSMDEKVLRQSCRGHFSKDVIVASKLIKQNGFKLGHQIMIGLPEDSFEKAVQTTKKLIELKPDMFRIYPTLVIRNTKLEQMYFNGNYTPLTLEEAVKISKQLLKLLKINGIKIIRVGLQVSEEINSDKEVVAGPFHPAFKELVESELRLETIMHGIDKLNIDNTDNDKALLIEVNNRETSITSGHKKQNIKRLYSLYNFKEIKIVGNDKLKPGCIKINIKGQTITIDENEYLKVTIEQ